MSQKLFPNKEPSKMVNFLGVSDDII